MNGWTSGAISGIVATAAMTLAMNALYRRLPREERYPLPPAEITAEVARRAGLPRQSTVETTQLAHFAYGAAAGALYGAVKGPGRGNVAEGAAYGVGVWTASYLGWIPAVRILKPATRHPLRRNALMLAVHLVWGGSLALCNRLAEGASPPERETAPASLPHAGPAASAPRRNAPRTRSYAGRYPRHGAGG